MCADPQEIVEAAQKTKVQDAVRAAQKKHRRYVLARVLGVRLLSAKVTHSHTHARVLLPATESHSHNSFPSPFFILCSFPRHEEELTALDDLLNNLRNAGAYFRSCLSTAVLSLRNIGCA